MFQLGGIRVIVLGLVCVVTPLGALASQGDAVEAVTDQSGAFSRLLQVHLQRLTLAQTPETAGVKLRHMPGLMQAYGHTDFAPIWTTDSGWHAKAEALLDYLVSLPQHGLSGRHYHVPALQQLREQATLANRIHSDLLLSDAFLSLLADLRRHGTAMPDGQEAQGIVQLMLRLKPHEDPAPSLDAWLPQDPQYWHLSRALKRMLDDASLETDLTPLNMALKPGQTHPQVVLLSRRLRQLGDYAGDDSQVLSGELVVALQSFQRRHGLDADGVVGPATRDQLNASADDRIRQLISNLHRYRQSTPVDASSHIRVNIAAQELRYIHEGQLALRMKVIVGRDSRPTPLAHSAINEVVVNPDWTVPYRIAVRDKLPIIQRDPDYLQRHGFTVQQSWHRDAEFLDPSQIDWNALTAANFPYVLRQRPGPENALGQVKFMFPNAYSVYLHDTPNHELFQREQRLFSSGCVRLSEPMQLAHLLLENHAGEAHLGQLAQPSETRSVPLRDPVPIHLEYWTAWADDRGELHWRPDVYGHDRELLAELDARGQLPSPALLIADMQRHSPVQLAASASGQSRALASP